MNRLSQLALNDDGFVFDPTRGESYTVTPSGLFLLKGLKEEKNNQELVDALLQEFDVSPEKAERDVLEFVQQLRTYHLIGELSGG